MVFLVAVLASLAQAPRQPANAAPTGNAKDGKKLFASVGCYQCHGYEGQGSNATGPRLGPRPIAFAAFSRYVIVSDTDLTNTYAFIRSRPEPAQETPLPRP